MSFESKPIENLSHINVIKNLMKKHGISFRKGLGQNFLINPGVAPKMADKAVYNENLGVIEIGPGIGVLSVELAKRAKKVVSIEIDKGLKPILDTTLKNYKNISVLYDDVLEVDLKSLIKNDFSGLDVVVCANLPYYITTPIIMKLLESKIPVEAITVMVQKEMATRFCAPLGTRESGAITVSMNYYAEASLDFNVSRGSFMPAPDVDSSVITLKVLKKPPIAVIDEEFFFRVLKASFSMRRKTILNCLSKGLEIEKAQVRKSLEEIGVSPSLRAENLLLLDYEKITNILYKYK